MGSNIHFQRGQVWYVDDNYIAQGSIQGKSRPYLVVSNDACNRFSPVIHMAPLTTQSKKESQPTHVKIFNPRTQKDNWVLCEQAMPKSVPHIKDVSDYWFTLSKETMDEVNKALAIQFALKSFGVDVSDFETMLDMIVEQKIAQIQDATQSLLDARMSRYVDGLMNRVANAGKLPDPSVYVPGPEVLEKIQSVPPIVVPTVEPTPDGSVVHFDEPPKTETRSDSARSLPPQKKERPASAIDRFNAKWGMNKGKDEAPEESKPVPKAEPTPEPEVKHVTRPEIIRGKGGRIKWSDELRKQFLEDMASYGPKKVMEIWGLGQTSMYAYQTKFKNKLMDTGTLSENHAESLAPNRGRPRSNKKVAPVEPQVSFEESSEILHDYDNMPLSKFMKKYNIDTRAHAVEFAAKLRVG